MATNVAMKKAMQHPVSGKKMEQNVGRASGMWWWGTGVVTNVALERG